MRGPGTLLAMLSIVGGMVLAGGPVAADPVCGGLELVRLDVGEVLCTHGDDTSFAAAAANEPTRTDGAVPAAGEQCYGDGINGPRVQVLYAYVSGGENKLVSLRRHLMRWSRQVEWTVAASAQRHGGRRHVRWVTTLGPGGRCQIDIRAVAVPSVDLSDFGRTVSELRQAGWNETDRKYLVFTDSDAYCGLASAPRDERTGATNASERSAGYARVDRRCWGAGDRGTGSTAAHELLHTIGAVQDSAPHATGRAHCTDEHDLLCYADGGAAASVRCRDGRSATSGAGDRNNRLLDCGGDDYFHPSPRPGSYLADHWNTASSSFLARRPSDGAGHRGADRPDVARDPQGRPQRWPAGSLGGRHRPLLPDAHGWEGCDLPVEVLVAPAPASDVVDGVVGTVESVLGRAEPDPMLDAAVSGAVADVNAAVGRSVLRYRGGAATGPPSDGELAVTWGDLSSVADPDVTVRDVRIRRAEVELDRERMGAASAQVRRTFALHGLALALGVGKVDAPRDLMAATPRPDADRSGALGSLRHVYGQPCDVDPRLDTTTGPAASTAAAGGEDDAGLLSRPAASVAADGGGEAAPAVSTAPGTADVRLTPTAAMTKQAAAGRGANYQL